MPDQTYLDKYKQVFGMPYQGVYTGARPVIYGDQPAMGAQGTNSWMPQPAPVAQPPIVRLPPVPGPVPVPPPTPPDTTAVPPGQRRRRRWGWYRQPGPPPWAHGGQGHREGGDRDRDHRRRHSYGPRPTPAPYVPPPPPPPAPIIPAPAPIPAPTGKICPTWGWMVSTNPDGSETVHPCSPGLPAAPGLHGLDGLLDSVTAPIAATLGPNWMLYLGVGVAAYFLMKRR